MNGGHFRELVGGALALWEADAQACFDGDAPRCRILRRGQILAGVAWEHTALGGAWRIDVPGRTVPEQARDARLVDRLAREVQDAVAALLDQGLAERRGLFR